MARFLVFTLAAPLAAFGDVAPGERRVSADRPGHSALAGLIAAALGLTRDDPRQDAVADALAFAVRIDAPGAPLVDYHTTQTPPARRNRRFATRREELSLPREELNTILSQRAYLTDAAFTVAAIERAGAGPFTLEEIAQALARPRFALHAGRKACPLGLPPSARAIEVGDVLAAFSAYDALENEAEDRRDLRKRLGLGGATRPAFAWDGAFVARGLVGPLAAMRRETRRDRPIDRSRRLFGLREEHVGHLPRVDAEAGGAP